MKFTVNWQELKYDAFDNIDTVTNHEPIDIIADDIDNAKKIASASCEATINDRKPDKTTGMFIPRLISLTDEDGNITVLNSRLKIGENNTLENI